MKLPDVIVVGAGVIGLACAWRLAQAGLRVTLFEARSPGAGASGAALGSLIPASVLRDGPIPELQRESLGSFEGFCREVERESGASTQFDRCGRFEVFGSEGRAVEARREVERAPARLGWATAPVQAIVSSSEVAGVVPGVVAPHGGLWCAATAQVDPTSLLAALRGACLHRSVVIETESPVEGLRVEDGRVVGVRCKGLPRDAGRVLVTAGACRPVFDAILHSAAPVSPARGVAILLRLPGTSGRAIIRRKSIYVMRRDDDHVVVGATTSHQDHFDAAADDDSVRELREGVVEFLPSMARAELIEAWAGLRPSSATLRPYIGSVPDLPGLVVATGHYKMGIALAPLTAELITHEIIQGVPARDLRALAPRSGLEVSVDERS